jgi:hypothetical protein
VEEVTMSDPYVPGRQSKVYHSLTSTERAEITKEVDRLFVAETGVTRSLHPSSFKDRDLRGSWLRIRDSVMEKHEVEEDMAFRRDMFVSDLVDIVLADMEFDGWKQAVTLLQTWAQRPPSIRPKYSAAVTNVVTMDWILGFPRARTVYDQILKDKIWTNDKSKERIATFLKTKPRAPGQPFGDLSLPVERVDDEWINSRPVVGGLSYDALAGAIGSFQLQVAIVGKVIVNGYGAFQLLIEEIGIYAKDSFDFSSDDFLGVWGYRDDPVYDSDFRQWRTQNNAGGDFMVYSDIKRTKLTTPDLVTGSL